MLRLLILIIFSSTIFTQGQKASWLDYVIEEKPREGVTTYKLKFRAEEERDGYLMLVRSRVRHHMNLRTYELSWKETDDVGDHIDCTAFKIHVYNKER